MSFHPQVQGKLESLGNRGGAGRVLEAFQVRREGSEREGAARGQRGGEEREMISPVREDN